MKLFLRRGRFLVPVLALCGLAVDAQTVYGVNGTPLVEEITGPPAGPCSYPSALS